MIKGGRASPDAEVRVARTTAFVVGVVAIVGGILVNGLNVAFLVALAFAVAASANLPTILYSLFWRRFNTTGALCSIYGGLVSCVLLIVFSPVVSGPKGIVPNGGWAVFPLENPGIVSIPLGFFFGWLGTVTSKDQEALDRYDELEVRSLTGAGAEGAVAH